MVPRIITAMTREIRGLHEAAYLLAVFTFLSQVLALIRDRAFAYFFGAGSTLDAYFAAFRIPDIVFALITLFVSAYALVPMIAERGGSRTPESRALLGAVLVSFGAVAVVVSGILYVAMPRLVPVLFPGFTVDALTHVTELSRIMLLQPILLGLSSIAASVIQASRQFILYALAPIFYNLGIIAGAIFLYPALGPVGLAWGVVLGAALHFCVQFVPLVASGTGAPTLTEGGLAEVPKVALLSLPRALALSATQVLLLAFAGAASLAGAGSVAALTFAYNLQSVTLSVVGVSYASALFPALAALWAAGEREKFMIETWAAVRHVIFWTLPAITLIIVLRAHIVRVILGAGAFTWDDTRITAALLGAFAVSLAAQAALLVFSRAYYAAHLSRTPIIVNVAATLVAALAAYQGVQWVAHAPTTHYFVESLFRIGDIPGAEVVIIAVLYSLIITAAAIAFGVAYARRFGFDARTLGTALSSFAASVIAAVAAYEMLRVFGPLLPTETFVGILVQGAAAGVAGLVVWALVLLGLKSPELREVIAVVRRFVAGAPRTD